MSGPPPTPNEILRKRGTDGAGHRLHSVPKDTQKLPRASRSRLPTPPRPLGSVGAAMWKRIWSAGLDWISPASDTEMVLVVCEIADEIALVRASIMDGDPLPGTLLANEKRVYDVLKDLRTQYLNGLSRLGFTPTDRARISVGEVEPADPLAEFRGAG